MIGFIKNLFKPKTFKEVKQEYKQAKANYIAKVKEIESSEYFFKVACKLADNFAESIIETNIIPGQTYIPYLWEEHIRLCLEFNHIEQAVMAIYYYKLDVTGTNINLKPLEDMVYNSKAGKEYKIHNKKLEIEQDFV